MRSFFADPDSLYSFTVPLEKLRDQGSFSLDSFPVSPFSRNIVASVLTGSRGNLLLHDEADSLFIDRRKAERNWERSQTNELLTRMEDYSGILVCCSNRREDFDPASMRRFQWKLNFRPPLPAQRLELYRRYFAQLCGESDEAVRSALDKLEGLCPGDFATVRKALLTLHPARGGGPALAHSVVLSRLRDELGCREGPPRRRIGYDIGGQA